MIQKRSIYCRLQVFRVCLYAFVFSIVFSTSTVLAETIKLTYATNTAPTHLRGEAEKMFLEEIEKQSNGQVKINPFWGQSLLKGKEILKGVKDAVVDMGHVNANYYPKRLILNGSLGLIQQGPVKYNNKMWTYDSIFKEIPQLEEEFKKFNQKIIYYYSVLPLAIAFTDPVVKIADYKGKRIRSSSRWVLAILKGTGAVPVSIPWGDCYMALQTNAIEGVNTNYDSIRRAKLDEVAKNIFVTKELWVSTPYLITMNLDKWKKLPKEIQKNIEDAAIASRARFTNSFEKWFERTVEAQQKMGDTVTLASKEDIDTWVNLPEVKEVEQQWITEAKAGGAGDAEVVLERIKHIVKEGIERDNN